MHIIRVFWLRVLIIFVVIIASHSTASAKIRVIATIKPIHALVASVMSGVGEPQLLIRGANSPHNFALRPSDARNLSKADVIFWVGADMEIFMIKPLKTLSSSATVIELSKTKGLKLLPSRHVHEEEDHGHKDIDPHFWLNPDNARVMVAEIIQKLSMKDPQNAKTYADNGAALINQLNTLTAELTLKLAVVKTKPFIVFHDAFQYFENRFNLKAIDAITLNPDRVPGAKKIKSIRSKIVSKNVVCVFAEPQFTSGIIETVIHKTSARLATLDPLGVDIPEGPAAYTALMHSLADALVSCLSEQK